MSQLTLEKGYLSLTHIASLSVRIASLKHEDSSTRRISQDLRSRKSANVQADRFSNATSSDEPHRLRPRASSPARSRTTSAVSPIPETPQRLYRSDKDKTPLTDPTATVSVILEQPLHLNVSSASQLDDDMRRKSSLNEMVSRALCRACSEADTKFS